MAVLSSPIRSPIRSPIYDPTVGKGGGVSDPTAAFIVAAFAGGKRGFAICPWMLNTLFQERTGALATTPAGVGGPVGTMASLVNGWYATAVSDAKRGVLRQVGGLYYIEMDGTDDCYRITSLTLGTSQYEWLATEQTSGQRFMMEHGAGAYGTADGHAFYGTGNGPWAMQRGGSAHYADPGGIAVNWADGRHINERSYVALTGGSYFRDGVEQSNYVPSGTARSEADITAQYNIGSRNQTTLFLGGKYFGHFLADGAAPSSDLILQGRQILATRSGVTL